MDDLTRFALAWAGLLALVGSLQLARSRTVRVLALLLFLTLVLLIEPDCAESEGC